jgi:hypothetical protein
MYKERARRPEQILVNNLTGNQLDNQAANAAEAYDVHSEANSSTRCRPGR